MLNTITVGFSHPGHKFIVYTWLTGLNERQKSLRQLIGMYIKLNIPIFPL